MKQLFKALVNLFGILFLLFLNGMLVDGFQHIVCSVAHAFLGVFIGDADCQHDRGVHVPQIMEAEMGDACLFTDAFKAIIHGVARQVYNVIFGMVLGLNQCGKICGQMQSVLLCRTEYRVLHRA